ncbi:eukaryotic translation initiation factor eIF2A-domain-containing protein [Umbelopsis sp. PMI_123]|nr:eukaryotic translation initiation factor eIF2A-domain-containing protein [Umbelopsis sp. PMI_123]
MTAAIPQFAYRSLKELAVWNGYPDFKPLEGFDKPAGSARTFAYSKHGNMFAYVTNESVKVFDAVTDTQISEVTRTNVIDVWFSPKGTYFATWERPTKLEDGSGSNNLLIWESKTGAQFAAFSQKAYSNSNIQWTEDEQYCARMVTGEVHFWESKNVGQNVWAKLKLEGIAQFSLSPGKSPAVAVFIPERKGAPAIVRMYGLPNFKSALSNKTFYKADKIQMYWNDLGTNLLVLTQTEVDKTGKSYYGETNLYYLAVAGNFDCRVVLDKEGPIHDVTWGPDSKEFVVVYGSMPSKATLFDHRANPVFDFGTNPRNFVKYNPQGRIICFAGFGNLNGTVDFWDRKTLKKICTFSAANSSYCEWSPDGRFLMTATLTPRLRVDNGFKMWHYTGTLIYHESIDELYQIGWRPASATSYPMRALSPVPKPIKSEVNGDVAKPAAQPAGAYRPPHLRGTATPPLYKGDGSKSSTPPPRQSIPGAPIGSSPKPSAKINKKKKDTQKSEETNGTASPSDSQGATGLSEKDKKVRNLEKKLRQIRDLKDRQLKGDTLEATQVAKIATEASLLRELSQLRV